MGFFFDEYVTDAAPINNPFFNFIDRSLTFFYPCRLRCEAAKERHEVFAKTLRESGYGDFVDETERLFASPVLLLGPKNPEALTLPLHFDEIFRIHFIGKRIGESVVAYADFFLTSLSFLDQKADSEYARNCLRVLDAALA